MISAHNQLSMFVATKAKQYPHLATYLQATSERSSVAAGPVLFILFGCMLGFFGLPILLITLLFHGTTTIPLGMIGIGALSLFGGVTLSKRGKSKPSALEIEARAISGRLRATFEKKWFGRVRPNPTLLLLDECARHWTRTKDALDSLHWRRSDLPKHYLNIKDQASLAADRAMQEALVLAGPHLPASPEKRDWSDMLEDVLQEVLKVPGPPARDHLPIQFAPAREIAEKLRSLAQEVETLTKQVAEEPAIEPAFTAEHQLDLAIQEIRTVREAETELRQQTRG